MCCSKTLCICWPPDAVGINHQHLTSSISCQADERLLRGMSPPEGRRAYTGIQQAACLGRCCHSSKIIHHQHLQCSGSDASQSDRGQPVMVTWAHIQNLRSGSYVALLLRLLAKASCVQSWPPTAHRPSSTCRPACENKCGSGSNSSLASLSSKVHSLSTISGRAEQQQPWQPSAHVSVCSTSPLSSEFSMEAAVCLFQSRTSSLQASPGCIPLYGLLSAGGCPE